MLNDPEVSRHHVRIERLDGGFAIVDLGSGNSTRLNDVKLEPKQTAALGEGDTVQIGESRRRPPCWK